MKLIIVQLIFLLLPAFIYTKCCSNTGIKFELRNKSLECIDFGAKRYFPIVSDPVVAQMFVKKFNRVCEIDVCGDGEIKPNSRYCGKGHCNFLGCACEGGCIEGEARENFFGKHGSKVSSLHF